MSIALEGSFWRDKYAKLTPSQMANELTLLARNMRLTKYRKAKWKPKKKPKKAMNKKHRKHVSAARVLEESRGMTAGIA